MEFDALSNRVIGCAIDVHRALGPGLLESAYQKCLAYELTQAGIRAEFEYQLPLKYREVEIDCGYRIDLFVERQLIVELKCVDELLPIHVAQLLTYMKLADVRTGLLMNFNVERLKQGLKRMVL